jgi:MFS family permease
LVFLLLAIFFWFTGFNAIETFFSTYGEAVLGVDKSVSSQLLLSVSILFLIFAMPAGIVSRRFGRKNTILTGLCLFIFTCVSLIFIKKVAIMYFLLGLGGISWALININSYPMVVEMTSSGGVGKYTGYYYLFSMLAAIISPILYGFLADMLGDGFLFIYAAVALVIALFFMMLVKHGEAPMEEKKGFENLEHMES